MLQTRSECVCLALFFFFFFSSISKELGKFVVLAQKLI